jgi:hypothetical protein
MVIKTGSLLICWSVLLVVVFDNFVSRKCQSRLVAELSALELRLQRQFDMHQTEMQQKFSVHQQRLAELRSEHQQELAELRSELEHLVVEAEEAGSSEVNEEVDEDSHTQPVSFKDPRGPRGGPAVKEMPDETAQEATAAEGKDGAAIVVKSKRSTSTASRRKGKTRRLFTSRRPEPRYEVQFRILPTGANLSDHPPNETRRLTMDEPRGRRLGGGFYQASPASSTGGCHTLGSGSSANYILSSTFMPPCFIFKGTSSYTLYIHQCATAKMSGSSARANFKMGTTSPSTNTMQSLMELALVNAGNAALTVTACDDGSSPCSTAVNSISVGVSESIISHCYSDADTTATSKNRLIYHSMTSFTVAPSFTATPNSLTVAGTIDQVTTPYAALGTQTPSSPFGAAVPGTVKIGGSTAATTDVTIDVGPSGVITIPSSASITLEGTLNTPGSNFFNPQQIGTGPAKTSGTFRTAPGTYTNPQTSSYDTYSFASSKISDLGTVYTAKIQPAELMTGTNLYFGFASPKTSSTEATTAGPGGSATSNFEIYNPGGSPGSATLTPGSAAFKIQLSSVKIPGGCFVGANVGSPNYNGGSYNGGCKSTPCDCCRTFYFRSATYCDSTDDVIFAQLIADSASNWNDLMTVEKTYVDGSNVCYFRLCNYQGDDTDAGNFKLAVLAIENHPSGTYIPSPR